MEIKVSFTTKKKAEKYTSKISFNVSSFEKDQLNRLFKKYDIQGKTLSAKMRKLIHKIHSANPGQKPRRKRKSTKQAQTVNLSTKESSSVNTKPAPSQYDIDVGKTDKEYITCPQDNLAYPINVCKGCPKKDRCSTYREYKQFWKPDVRT